jgi:hypothetical protein
LIPCKFSWATNNFVVLEYNVEQYLKATSGNRNMNHDLDH